MVHSIRESGCISKRRVFDKKALDGNHCNGEAAAPPGLGGSNCHAASPNSTDEL